MRCCRLLHALHSYVILGGRKVKNAVAALVVGLIVADARELISATRLVTETRRSDATAGQWIAVRIDNLSADRRTRNKRNGHVAFLLAGLEFDALRRLNGAHAGSAIRVIRMSGNHVVYARRQILHRKISGCVRHGVGNSSASYVDWKQRDFRSTHRRSGDLIHHRAADGAVIAGYNRRSW